jgi:predicted transcriptional regulator
VEQYGNELAPAVQALHRAKEITGSDELGKGPAVYGESSSGEGIVGVGAKHGVHGHTAGLNCVGVFAIMGGQTGLNSQSRGRELLPQLLGLGPLEKEIMDVLWTRGPGNVRGVASRIGRKLAYTTVMTTLARLYRKGFLHRDKVDRAYVYSVRVSFEEWNLIHAHELIEGFLIGSPCRSLLLSCLIDAVGTHDGALLDEVNAKIQRKREELANENRAPAPAAT